MYSVVLMAALTSGTSAPDGWWHCGCRGGSFGGYSGSPASGWGNAIEPYCFGCHGCYGSLFGTGFNPYGFNPYGPEQIPPPKVDEKKGGSGQGSVAPDRAKVVVQLPAGAKLYVDDQPIKATSGNQAFNTPRLEHGETYYYQVRAEAVRDGKTVVESQRIRVKAGQEVTVSFPKLAPPGTIAAADPNRGR